MSGTSDVHARIHVLLARDEPYGLVIRRGPSKHVCSIGWHRKSDSFRIGQWLKGRIYEERCDLSPDGKSFLYFALNGRWDSETRGAWTAISQYPYLKAIGLWAEGGTWGGGGLWVDNLTYWLNGGGTPIRESRGMRWEYNCPVETIGGLWSRGVYFARLIRDGWTMCRNAPRSENQPTAVFERPVHHGWTLRKLVDACAPDAARHRSVSDGHELVNLEHDLVIDCPSWEWADLDRDRLVWSERGRLFAAQLTRDGLDAQKLLYDFNPMKFEPIAAPYNDRGEWNHR